MEKNMVMIYLERYDELIKADLKLKTVKEILEQDKNEYGYSSNTSKAVDAILGITRE